MLDSPDCPLLDPLLGLASVRYFGAEVTTLVGKLERRIFNGRLSGASSIYALATEATFHIVSAL
jgi:hypothetical protein